MNEVKICENWFTALELKKEVEDWIIKEYILLANNIKNANDVNLYGSNNHNYRKAILENTALKFIKSLNMYKLEFGMFFIYPTTSLTRDIIFSFLNLEYTDIMFTGFKFKINDFSSSRYDKTEELCIYFEKTIV